MPSRRASGQGGPAAELRRTWLRWPTCNVSQSSWLASRAEWLKLHKGREIIQGNMTVGSKFRLAKLLSLLASRHDKLVRQAEPGPASTDRFLYQRSAAGRPQCSTGGQDTPLLFADGRMAARHRRAPMSALALWQVVAYPLQTSVLCGTIDSLLDSSSYCVCWVLQQLLGLSTDPHERPADQGLPSPRWPPTIKPLGLVGWPLQANASSQARPGRSKQPTRHTVTPAESAVLNVD